VNLGSLRSQAKIYLMGTSTDTSSIAWSDAELNRYANEGVFYIQQLTEFYQDSDNKVVTAGTATYAAPSLEHQFIRLSYDRDLVPQTNEYELDRDTQTSWRGTQSGVPQYFYRPTLNQVALYPPPNTSGDTSTFASELGVVVEITGDTTYALVGELGAIIGFTDDAGSICKFKPDINQTLAANSNAQYGILINFTNDEGNLSSIFVAIPQQMTSDLDIPQLPPFTHWAIINYMVAKAFAREGEFQDMDAAQAWFEAFKDWMGASLGVQGRWWPTSITSLEPWQTGDRLNKRLQSVSIPSFLRS
jgi:hypothetical protein